MATKNISITEDAYDRLAALRRAGESFSAIIKRLTHASDIMQFAGILSNESADALAKRVAQHRTVYNKNLKERMANLRGDANRSNPASKNDPEPQHGSSR